MWEDSAVLELTAGRHTLRFERAGAFPHVVALRCDSPVVPEGFTLWPKARKLPKTAAAPVEKLFANEPDPAALRLAIEDLIATFGPRYPQGPGFLQQVAALEAALQQPAAAAPAKAGLVALRREALLANPLLDGDRVLILKRGFATPAAARNAMGQALGVGSLNAHTSDDTPRQGHWDDELTLLSNLRGQPVFTTVHRPDNRETVIDPVLDFDARAACFSPKTAGKGKNWRLWEIGIDGQGLRQVTRDCGADVGQFDHVICQMGGSSLPRPRFTRGCPASSERRR